MKFFGIFWDLYLKKIKTPLYKGGYEHMAESMRFELMVAFTTQPFQDCTLNHSDNSPSFNIVLN